MSQLVPGFYGKLPMTGDFIHRRLQPVFLNRWDEWLKHNIAHSQYTLGDNWLNVYLTSPMWRFVLSPGIINEQGFCGVMIPSVDSVGRYFPLTLVQPLPAQAAAFVLTDAANLWFQQLEDILLDMLEGFHEDTAQFDEKLKQVPANWIQQLPSNSGISLNDLNKSDAHLSLNLQGNNAINQTLSTLLLSSLMNNQTTFSLWWQQSSQAENSHCLYTKNLPSTQQFTALFDNSWQEHGWRQLDLAGPVIDNPPTHSTQDIATTANTTQTVQLDPLNHNSFDNDHEKTRPPKSPISNHECHSLNSETAPISNTSTKYEMTVDNDITVSPLARKHDRVITNQQTDNCNNLEPTTSNNRLRKSVGFTDTGNYRDENEDALLLKPSAGLWVVADGMGGHQDGAYASKAVVDQLNQVDLGGSLEQALSRIKISLDTVNADLIHYAENQSNQGVCGSTVIGLLIRNQQCAFFWAGDSRLYLYRNKQLTALSKDHSIEQEQIDKGILPTTGDNFTGKNLITRAVGGDKSLALDVCYHKLQNGDKFLLCSDGVYNEMDQPALTELINQAENLESASLTLKKQILAGQARDNFTAIFVDS